MIVVCKTCSTEFEKPNAWAKRVKNHFCSKNCHDVFQTQIIKKQCIICEDIFYVRPSESHKFSTCSKRCQRINRTKQKNPNWQGGTSKGRKAEMATTEYKEWRLSVFKRDNFTCVFCGKDRKSAIIQADHIKPWAFFPELRYDLANGRTLCVDCHKTTYKGNLQWRKKNAPPT